MSTDAVPCPAPPIRLRPHHGLCLGFFRGLGYDEAFCSNLAAVLVSLQPESRIQLISGQDVLCACCPHRITPCPRAAAYDRQVLTFCALEPEQILTWHAFRNRLQSAVLLPGHLEEICGDCRWFPVCRAAKATVPDPALYSVPASNRGACAPLF